jgi:CheY-like chemotaxis protein
MGRAPDPVTLEETMEGGGARILVVDDNASVRRSLVALLTRVGHEVIEAANGSARYHSTGYLRALA